MQANLARNVHCLLGLPFDATDMAGAVQRVRDAAARRSPCFISTPNLNFLISCRRDSAFRDSVIRSDLSIADGMPLVWMAGLLGIPIKQRVAGSELFDSLKSGEPRSLSVYFFGGPAGAGEAAARRLNAEGSGLACVGFESPGLGSVEELSRDESIERINGSGADLLVVALGAKKGQAWIERNRRRISVPAISHLGAVINFTAGTVRRAPPWMQRTGLEWLWRIREEPVLWRRYAADGWQLLQLLATRVLPYAWALWRQKRRSASGRENALQVADRPRETLLRLAGVWDVDNLTALRQCLSTLIEAKRNVRINLQDVSFVDSAFLGLLMLLYGMQKEGGRRLVCEAASPGLRKLFVYACCDFLLDDTGQRPSQMADAEMALDTEETAHP